MEKLLYHQAEILSFEREEGKEREMTQIKWYITLFFPGLI